MVHESWRYLGCPTIRSSFNPCGRSSRTARCFQESVEVPWSTVGELLGNLVARFGELLRHLYAEDGRLGSFVNVYVNDEDFRYLQREQTSLCETDIVSIVGGRPSGVRP
jgi:molybdopterin converting factor small subunit